MSFADFLGLFSFFERAAAVIEGILDWLDESVRTFSETHRPVERTMEAFSYGMDYLMHRADTPAAPHAKKKE